MSIMKDIISVSVDSFKMNDDEIVKLITETDKIMRREISELTTEMRYEKTGTSLDYYIVGEDGKRVVAKAIVSDRYKSKKQDKEACSNKTKDHKYMFGFVGVNDYLNVLIFTTIDLNIITGEIEYENLIIEQDAVDEYYRHIRNTNKKFNFSANGMVDNNEDLKDIVYDNIQFSMASMASLLMNRRMI